MHLLKRMPALCRTACTLLSMHCLMKIIHAFDFATAHHKKVPGREKLRELYQNLLGLLYGLYRPEGYQVNCPNQGNHHFRLVHQIVFANVDEWVMANLHVCTLLVLSGVLGNQQGTCHQMLQSYSESLAATDWHYCHQALLYHTGSQIHHSQICPACVKPIVLSSAHKTCVAASDLLLCCHEVHVAA